LDDKVTAAQEGALELQKYLDDLGPAIGRTSEPSDSGQKPALLKDVVDRNVGYASTAKDLRAAAQAHNAPLDEPQSSGQGGQNGSASAGGDSKTPASDGPPEAPTAAAVKAMDQALQVLQGDVNRLNQGVIPEKMQDHYNNAFKLRGDMQQAQSDWLKKVQTGLLNDADLNKNMPVNLSSTLKN
jgi:hypothetical protein